MKSSNSNKTFKQLIRTRERHQNLITKLEFELKNKIEFDFAIVFQPSDDHCILNVNNSDLAPLNLCLHLIDTKGFLSLDDFNRLGI